MEAMQLQRSTNANHEGEGAKRTSASSGGLPSSSACDPSVACRCFACGPETFNLHHRLAEREVPPAPRSLSYISSLPEHGCGHGGQPSPRASATPTVAIDSGSSAALPSPSPVLERPPMARRRIRGKQPPGGTGILLISLGNETDGYSDNTSEQRMTSSAVPSTVWCRPAQQSSWASRVIIHRVARPSPCRLCLRPSRIICRGCQGAICIVCARLRSWCGQPADAAADHLPANSGHDQSLNVTSVADQSSRIHMLQEVEAIQRTVVFAAPPLSSVSSPLPQGRSPVVVAAEAASASHGIGPPLQRYFHHADEIADRVEMSPTTSSSAAAAGSSCNWAHR